MSHLRPKQPLHFFNMIAEQNSALIKVHRLKKIYNTGGDVGIAAVRDVDLTIAEGDFVALMGPSGSGKSTLMNLLAFLDAPTSGEYEFAGMNIATFDADYRAELRNNLIGFVFQQFHLLPRTTALENVRLPLVYAKVRRSEQIERAYEMLKRVGLAERIYHRPNELSGGQQQRVSIARALINNPKVIFCDEPTGNLDSRTSIEIMEIIKTLHAEGRTIIMVTHESNIAQYAARILHMKDGQILPA